jgi:serine O-acetyltransferase
VVFLGCKVIDCANGLAGNRPESCAMGLLAFLKEDLATHRKFSPHQGLIAVVLDRCFLVCANYRFGFWACRLKLPLVGQLLRLIYVFTNLLVSTTSGTDIRSGAIIGRRFYVHTTFGVMIADGVMIGDDCTVFTGACVVNKANNRGEGQPRIGNNVTLGVGSKILGGVTIGNNVVVGANAVVLRDVPSNHMAVGVPAQHKPMPAERPAAHTAKAVSGPG